MGTRPDGARPQRARAGARPRQRSRQHRRIGARMRVRSLCCGRRNPRQRKLAASRGRGELRRATPHRARPSAGLSVAAFQRRLGRLLADGVCGAHPARRIRAARKRLSPPHDGGDRSGILDRAETAIRPVVSRTDAGRPYQDHGRGQAVGAAALLWPGDPAQRQWGAALRPAQPGRRRQPRRGRSRRNGRRAVRHRQGAGPVAAAAARRHRAGAARMSDDIILALRNATKLYAGVPAIENVDFELRRGEIHALVGENGAGKSTLKKVRAGVVALTSGTMEVNGVAAVPRTPLEARNLGIAMVFQENSLVPTMTVAQNLFLGQERFYNRLRGIYIAAQQFLQSLNFDVTPTATVGLLGAAKKQMVEIARAVLHEAKVIIFDEPTATLTPEEKKYFFDLVRDLKRRGVSIVFISHALEEALILADRITILRDGKHVVTDDAASFDRARPSPGRCGRDLSNTLYGTRKTTVRPAGARVLTIQNLKMAPMVRNNSLSVFAGQITGVFGLVGAGRTETFKVVAGVLKRDFFHGGEVILNGRPVRYRVPAPAVRAGIAYVTEDRKVEGFFETMSVARNIYLGLLAKMPGGRFFLSNREADKVGKTWVEKLKVRATGNDIKVVELSGGNQQKVVIAKSLVQGPELIIFDEPTRGVDVGAIVEIHELIQRLADEGKAVVVISSYLPEIMALSDRILVSRQGKVVEEFSALEATEEKIMYAAVH